LVCCRSIRKYVKYWGIFQLTSIQPKYWWGCVTGILGGVDASVKLLINRCATRYVCAFCLISAEEYEESSDSSIDKMSADSSIVPEDVQGQGRQQGHERQTRARPIRPRYVPKYRQQMELDYDSVAAQ